MTMLDSTATALRVPHGDFALDQAHLAVVAFLARYRRSLDAAGQGGLDAQVLDLVVRRSLDAAPNHENDSRRLQAFAQVRPGVGEGT
jgi:hypothetical protein